MYVMKYSGFGIDDREMMKLMNFLPTALSG